MFKTIDKVISQFTKTVADLEALAKEHKSKADFAQIAIEAATQLRDENTVEEARAKRLAEKLNALIT